MPRPTRASLGLRTALLAGLVWLLLAGVWRVDERPGATRLPGEAADHDRLAALLVEPLPPTAVLRDAGQEPREHELQGLAALTERTPLFVELPPEGPALRVVPPDRPLAHRFAALRFAATAAPGDTVTVRLLDRGAVLDSLRVVADTAGAVAGALRVRPGRSEWLEWRVAIDGASAGMEGAVATVGAWVVEAAPPRVLVVAGPPSWESRYVVRALERSGAELSLVQRLGRDNIITAGGAAGDWASNGALDAYDVVVLLPGAAPDGEAMDSLEAWVLDGHGVLAASAAAGRLGLGSAAGDRLVGGDSLIWTAPPEVAPLPAADLDATAVVTSGVPPGVTVAARGPGGDPVLVVSPLGRGRAAGLGLRDSWRWVLEAGLEPEHRAFWRSLVDWLAAPSADSLAARVTPSEGAVGTTVDVELRRGSLALQRPGGDVEPIAAARGPEGPRGRFVPVDTGLHALRTTGRAGGGPTGGAESGPTADVGGPPALAAFRALPPDEAPTAELGRARLSLLAAASDGAALEPDAFAARVDAAASTGERRSPWLPWIFATLALLALAEWTFRRLSGLP